MATHRSTASVVPGAPHPRRAPGGRLGVQAGDVVKRVPATVQMVRAGHDPRNRHSLDLRRPRHAPAYGSSASPGISACPSPKPPSSPPASSTSSRTWTRETRPEHRDPDPGRARAQRSWALETRTSAADGELLTTLESEVETRKWSQCSSVVDGALGPAKGTGYWRLLQGLNVAIPRGG